MSPLMDVIRKKSVCFIIVLCLILTSAITYNSVDKTSAPVTFENGNLNVTGGSTYYIKDYIKPYTFTGNILVTGNSNLIIKDSTVIFRPDKFINVTVGSKLRIENSIITVDINTILPAYNLFFQILNSDFEIYNSTIEFKP